jgi:hypothetical protein
MIIQSFDDEVFEGSNKYHCENCGKHVEKAIKR